MEPNTPRRILIIDDNHSLVRIMENVLTREGFQALTAFDGVEGMEKAVNEKPDLIILDIEMPGPSGYQVCRQLQQFPPTENIPVLMLTVRGQLDNVPDLDQHTYQERLEERNRGYEVGAIEFISKPIPAKELVAAVKRLLWIDRK